LKKDRRLEAANRSNLLGHGEDRRAPPARPVRPRPGASLHYDGRTRRRRRAPRDQHAGRPAGAI